jgi:drug/metabolite transporter (DMT)-like permease
MASALLVPIAGTRLRTLLALGWRDLGLLALAGVALAAHFVAWIAAVQHTTVANAAVFFAINPVITATAAHFIFGERLGRRLLGAIGLGVLGIAAIGAADLRFSADQLLGDALAVLCSLLFTLYFLLGKRLRQQLDNRVYVTALYGVAGVVSFGALVALEQPVASYEPGTWLAFLLMALVPTMLGHTSLNLALRYMDAGRISTLTLSEPLLAGLVAMWAWGEKPGPFTLVGYALICASVLVTVREPSDRRALARPAVTP